MHDRSCPGSGSVKGIIDLLKDSHWVLLQNIWSAAGRGGEGINDVSVLISVLQMLAGMVLPEH